MLAESGNPLFLTPLLLPGDNGEDGVPGAMGEKGDRGFPGSIGLDGDPGPDGSPGHPGTIGAYGERGMPGGFGDKGEEGKYFLNILMVDEAVGCTYRSTKICQDYTDVFKDTLLLPTIFFCKLKGLSDRWHIYTGSQPQVILLVFMSFCVFN